MSFTLIDLTHTLTAESPSWNGKCGFNQEIKEDYDQSHKLVKFRVQQIKMHAGIGTHMDAPAHCILGGKTIDQIPLKSLQAPCAVVDVSSNMRADYSVSVQDIQNYENQHGVIRECAFVIFYTGWEQFWSHPAKYHNNYIFPSVSKEAAEFLLSERNIVGIGIDTLSPDRPESGFPVHQMMLSQNKYIVENVANARQLSPMGATILALPIKTKTTEAPMRLVGLELIDHKKSLKIMETILDVDGLMSNDDKTLSQSTYQLLFGKRVVAVRVMSKHKKELLIEFEGGTRLFVDNFNDLLDISIT